MQTIYKLITLECQNEHDLEHDLEHKRKFSTPKIFDADGDLKKRWYVYFSFRDPETGRMKRMKNIYGGANRFKTKAERYSVLNLYKKRLLRFLKQGYNPFEDNTELYQKHTQKVTTLGVKSITKPVVTENKHEHEHEQEHVSVKTQEVEAKTNRKTPLKTKEEKPPKPSYPKVLDAFNKALELKTNVTKAKTLEDYTYQYKDHLGNIRLTYMDSDNSGSINGDTEIIEENNYYPFGLKHKGYNDVVSANVNSQASKRKFQGEEFEDELGKNTYAYQWRDYDPALGRFGKIDRFAEKYIDKSPYSFTANNPIFFKEIKGDSLIVNDNAAKTAKAKYNNIITKGLGGYYKIGYTSTGKYQLLSTGKKGKMNSKQKALYNYLNRAMNSSKDVTLDVVDSSDAISQNIFVGDCGCGSASVTPGSHTLDVGDMENLGTDDSNLITAQGALGHETEEAYQIQQNGKKPLIAHQMGITADQSINGNKQNGGATLNASRTTLTLSITADNSTMNVQINFVNGQVKNVTNNINPKTFIKNHAKLAKF
ncbi:MAG: RHS repeat domain-containing protein [Winogradskyella sp.]